MATELNDLELYFAVTQLPGKTLKFASKPSKKASIDAEMSKSHLDVSNAMPTDALTSNNENLGTASPLLFSSLSNANAFAVTDEDWLEEFIPNNCSKAVITPTSFSPIFDTKEQAEENGSKIALENSNNPATTCANTQIIKPIPMQAFPKPKYPSDFSSFDARIEMLTPYSTESEELKIWFEKMQAKIESALNYNTMKNNILITKIYPPGVYKHIAVYEYQKHHGPNNYFPVDGPCPDGIQILHISIVKQHGKGHIFVAELDRPTGILWPAETLRPVFKDRVLEVRSKRAKIKLCDVV